MVNSSDSHVVNSLITLTKGLTVVALSISQSVITNVNPVDTDLCKSYMHVWVRIYLYIILKGYWHYHGVFLLELGRFCKCSRSLVRSACGGASVGRSEPDSAVVKQWPSHRTQSFFDVSGCEQNKATGNQAFNLHNTCLKAYTYVVALSASSAASSFGSYLTTWLLILLSSSQSIVISCICWRICKRMQTIFYRSAGELIRMFKAQFLKQFCIQQFPLGIRKK